MMRSLFLLSFTLLMTACMSTPDVSPEHTETAQSKISTNITDAQKAQNEYAALQKTRNQNH